MKTSNLSADNFKKILDCDGWTPEPAIRSGDTGQRISFFDSCQLITTLMCNISLPVALWSGRTVSRAVGRSVYGHVIAKFSRMGSLLHVRTHGAPLRALRARKLRYEYHPLYLQR